jgi:hypothetical protein
MRKDRYKALEMRRKNKSYNYISTKLGVPKSTLSGWFSKEPWSIELASHLHAKNSFKSSKRIRAVIKANNQRWEKIYKRCEEDAIEEFPKLKNNPLFLAGLMLYWGEGNKVESSAVKFTNGDPDMIRIFYRFLINTLGIPRDRITANLILYPDLIDSVQKNLWSKLTGIPITQFKKSTYIKGRHPTRRLSYGVCMIYAGGKSLKKKIMKWTELYKSHLENPSKIDRI